MDNITLHINNQKITDFESYRIESDLFVADDAFELVLANRNIVARSGDPVKLYVNGHLELNGILDSRRVQYSKQGTTLTLAGRDLMGLLTDAYVEEFITLQDYTLKRLAEKLLAPISHINRSTIIYGKGDKSRAVPLSITEEDYDYEQLEPGKTVFATLNEYALSRGMLFFCLPDGTLVFGQPQTSGKAVFSLINKRNDMTSNILDGDVADDISKRYSKTTVIAQSQALDAWAAEDVNSIGVVEDPDFPAGIYKPFVVEALYDGQNPQKYAQVLMDKYHFDGFNMSYKTQGHSQNGKNYTVNAISHVEDDIADINGNPINGDFLIYSRVFEMDKSNGSTTSIKLSKLGILPA